MSAFGANSGSRIFLFAVISVVFLLNVVVDSVDGLNGPVRPGTGNPSLRLPRTSASQINNNSSGYKLGLKTFNQTRNGNIRIR